MHNKFIQPGTDIAMTTKEAADTIGIHPATLCNRYNNGQRGEYLWRPSERTEFKSTLPSNKLTLTQERLLQKLPSETKFERRLK